MRNTSRDIKHTQTKKPSSSIQFWIFKKKKGRLKLWKTVGKKKTKKVRKSKEEKLKELEQQKKDIFKLKSKYTYQDIADTLGISKSKVGNIIYQYETLGKTENKLQGRPSKIKDKYVEFI